jgi:hypothetical protein
VLLHRWIMEQVLGRKLRSDEVVRHTCDNPPCFLFDHLVLGTQADNVRDMYEKGRNNNLPGSAHVSSKLSEDDVREIRRLLSQGWSGAALGRRFGVTKENVSHIKTGKIWKS